MLLLGTVLRLYLVCRRYTCQPNFLSRVYRGRAPGSPGDGFHKTADVRKVNENLMILRLLAEKVSGGMARLQIWSNNTQVLFETSVDDCKRNPHTHTHTHTNAKVQVS